MVNDDTPFVTSSFCSGGTCVGIKLDGETILVADTKDETAVPLRFDATEWNAFVQGVQAGEFELERLAINPRSEGL